MTNIAGTVAGNARYKQQLFTFGELVTKAALSPSDMCLQQQLDRAREALREAAGDTALVDAAGVAGFFNVMTRIVDASGHNNSAFERRVMGVVSSMLEHRRMIFVSLLLACGAAFASWRQTH